MGRRIQGLSLPPCSLSLRWVSGCSTATAQLPGQRVSGPPVPGAGPGTEGLEGGREALHVTRGCNRPCGGSVPAAASMPNLSNWERRLHGLRGSEVQPRVGWPKAEASWRKGRLEESGSAHGSGGAGRGEGAGERTDPSRAHPSGLLLRATTSQQATQPPWTTPPQDESTHRPEPSDPARPGDQAFSTGALGDSLEPAMPGPCWLSLLPTSQLPHLCWCESQSTSGGSALLPSLRG